MVGSGSWFMEQHICSHQYKTTVLIRLLNAAWKFIVHLSGAAQPPLKRKKPAG
jgi:hypothetical protein